MALESEPQSTPLGGSNLDALKSESSNNDVDLEDGEIDDDDEEAAVPTVPAGEPAPPAPHPAPVPAPAPPQVSPSRPLGPSPPGAGPGHGHGHGARAPPVSKGQDGGRRESHEGSNLPPWMQRRLGPAPTKSKKNSGKGSWGPPHKNNFVPEDDDDDFVKHLEKALQAKAREKAKQANKEKSEDRGDRYDRSSEEENDDHGKKRKKRKSSRDGEGDGERERDTKKRRREGDEEDDMIFVRGASPQLEPTGSPPYRDYDHDRSYDSYGEDGDDFDGSPDRAGPGGFSSRGRGRGNKVMRGSGRGRGRMNTQNDIGRGGFTNKRGNKRGKSQQRPSRERNQDAICMYYMQGKCPKEADECPFSHDAMPRRKMELCKFYNMNCCAKRDKCLYMHKDFPCKYFHTGRKCNSGEKCRYSHEPLSDVTRNVLLKHIELAPKEILGEFRRLTREQAIQIIDRAAKMRAEGKNPEGVDLLRSHEDEQNDSGDDRAHTPMPSSPSDLISNDPEPRRKRGEDSRRRDHHSERDRNRERDHNDWDDPPKNRKERRERKRKRRWDNPEDSPSQLMRLQETLQRQLEEEEEDSKFSEKKAISKQGEEASNYRMRDDNHTKTSKSSGETSKDDKPCSSNEKKFKFSRDSDSPEARDESEGLEKHDSADISGGDTGDDSQDTSASIPTHLPKRQRELFMRIQQQQREAEQNKDSKEEDSEDDVAADEDDCYSSDDDGLRSLTAVLKNLKDGQKDSDNNSRKQNDKESCRERGSLTDDSKNKMDELKDVNMKPGRRPPLLPTPNLLTDLVKNVAIDQLLSTIRYGPNGAVLPSSFNSDGASTSAQQENSSIPAPLESPSSAAPSVAPAPARDPRLLRDPRNRSSPLGPTSSPSASSSPNAAEVRSHRGDPRAERRDPRTERTDRRTEAMDPLGSPRTDQRDHRTVDPRSARAEVRRTSDGSNSSSSLQHSIYDSAPILSGAGDVDLRVRSIGRDPISDTDFRRQNSQFGAGDMDMRRDPSSGAIGANTLPSHDTDLRFRLGLPPRDPDGDYASASQNDMDLRRMQMMLPFKPAPVHTPATEIDGSLSSHTPGPYRVVRIDIPKPDFTHLKINPKDPQVKLDPRLRRVFGDSIEDTPASPPVEASHTPASPPPVFPRSDPRRRNSSSSIARPADSRQSRMGMNMNMGVGIGPGPMVCPPTPRVDDFDVPPMADTDLRMQAQYGRPSWDNSGNRGRGLLPHPDAWVPNTAASFGRAANIQPHSYHPQRSYTPPPT